MAMEKFKVTLKATRTEQKTTNVPGPSLNVVLSDSMIGSLEDAEVLRQKLGAPALTTEIVMLAMVTRKTPANVTTTAGKFFGELSYNAAAALAAKVAKKYGKSVYDVPAKFGGYGR